MLDASWQADYRDQARLALDASFLQGLMVEPEWVGLLVCDEDGQPAGFELAQERTLYCHQQPLRAYYNTLFTVSASHRRRGIGRWMLHCVNRLLFAERGAEVVFVAFHPGHAGLPTVQNTHAPMPTWGVQVFHTAAVWGKRLDLAPLPPLDHPPAALRLAWPPGEPELAPMAVERTPVPRPLPSVATLTGALSTHYQVAFGLGESFRSRYLRHDAPHGGTFWYDFASQAQCWISFDMVPLVCNTRRVGLLGRIQAVYAHHCTSAHLSQALHHLCGVFQDHGCFLAGVLDHGVIPHEVFHTLAFRSIGDTRMFAVRGPRAAIQAFETVQPPFFIDL
jgi:hypothetical protein